MTSRTVRRLSPLAASACAPIRADQKTAPPATAMTMRTASSHRLEIVKRAHPPRPRRDEWRLKQANLKICVYL